MVFAEVLLGVGMAFTSGADSALLFVSIDEGADIARYRHWEGWVRAAAQASEALSSGLGGWLYTLAPRLPFWSQVPVALANLAAVAAMREAPTAKPGERMAHLARAWHIVRYALVHHARLRSAMVLSVALGSSTYVAVWLIQPWMQRRGIPTVWFGPLWAGAHLCLAAVSLVSARIGRAFGLAPVLLACSLIGGVSYLALALSSSPLAVFFYLGFMIVRGLQGPLLAGVIQADAPREDRASVLSLNALLFRLAAVVVLPPIGFITDPIGLDALLGLLGILSMAAALAAWIGFARAHSKLA